MTIFDLVARERARITRLVQVDTALRGIVVAVSVLFAGAVALGGSRWITLPRLVPFVVWAAAIALVVLVARRGARAVEREASDAAIARAVEREQRLRNGEVYGLVELAGDGSAFVRRAAQRLGTQLSAAGDALTPHVQRRLRRGALEGLAVLVPLTGLAAYGASRDGNGWRALVHPVNAWRGTLLSKIDINGAPRRALRGATVKFAVMADGRTEISLRRRTTGNAWVDVTLPVVNGVAQAELGPVDADLTIVASDGRATSDTVVVRIVDRPFLGDVAVRAIYPSYLHRAAEALPSDAPIRVPRGTELTLEGHSSESLVAVTLSQGTDSIRLLPSERRFSGHFAPATTGGGTSAIDAVRPRPEAGRGAAAAGRRRSPTCRRRSWWRSSSTRCRRQRFSRRRAIRSSRRATRSSCNSSRATTTDCRPSH
jgi:hypothetical protein